MLVFMTVYVAGRINIDFIVEVNEVIVRGRKYVGKVLEVDVGGTATNIATAIARVERSLNPCILGAIGRDYKDFVFGKLSVEGINLKHLKILDDETGRAYIFVDPEGETTIISIPGVNDLYLGDFVPNVNDAKALVLGNTTSSAAVRLLNTIPRSTPIFVDPHNLWVGVSNIISSLGNPCFYMPNEIEFLSYARVDVDNLEAVQRYADKIGCSIIVKRGGKGAIAIQGTQLIRISAIKLDTLGLKMVSTAGCGDTFTGVFVAMYMRDGDVAKALKYATLAAAFKASRISPRASPTLAELEDFADRVEKKNAIDIRINYV